MPEASDAQGILCQNLADAGCGAFGAVKAPAAGLYAAALNTRIKATAASTMYI